MGIVYCRLKPLLDEEVIAMLYAIGAALGLLEALALLWASWKGIDFLNTLFKENWEAMRRWDKLMSLPKEEIFRQIGYEVSETITEHPDLISGKELQTDEERYGKK